MNRACLKSCVIAGLLLSGAAPVHAQWPYNPYYPGGYYGNLGPGATLSGGAQVIQATGNLYIQQEQARQQREKYNQEKLATKRMAFDEAKYEKANTPTPTEEQARILNLQVQRVLNQANPAEIERGETLNTLMPYIRALSDQGVTGPPVPVSPALLKQVNVKTGTASGAGAGLLKDAGHLTWPLMLRGPKQKEIDQLLPQACSQAAAGTLEPATYTKLVSAVQAMKDDLKQQYYKEKVNSSTFLSGQAYLDSLLDSLKLLERPDAAQYFNGAVAAHGSNVPDLVNNMLAQGLSFAPATPGDTAPYFALHNAFVSYARAARANPGFRVGSLAPAPTPVR